MRPGGAMAPTPPPEGLVQEIHRLQEMAGEWLRLFPQAAAQGQHWLKVLAQVRAHVAEEVCRLAVVGTVKSGKSTVINALVGQDLLKRGAGILTAMITRVQPGGQPRAVLKFKDWEEINGEVNRALGLLPAPRLKERAAPLDLREATDRELLAQVLADNQVTALWAEGSLDQNYLLLKSYLEGYDLIRGLMPGGGPLTLARPDLARHRDLVSQEASAVYLQDVLLTVPIPWAAAALELGDCQGSDSPVPQHLTQILAFLVKSDLVLYVISSRVGLRQADLTFLAELKRMGLAPHILPLLNLDLGEHTSLEEILDLKERLAQDLTSWQAQPRVYAFSALKLLLDRRRAGGEALDHREAALLKLWVTLPKAAAFSDAEADRFEEDLKNGLREVQRRRLAGGSLSQVQMVARGLKEQWELTRDWLRRDLTAIQEMEARLRERRQPLNAALASLGQTLEGAGHHLKKTLRTRVDSLMDPHAGQVGAGMLSFIRDYDPDWPGLLPPGSPSSFRPALYQLFQGFVKDLTHYVTQEVNVSLVEFIRAQEEWLRIELARTGAPLLTSLQEALTLYYREIEALGLAAAPPTLQLAANPRPPGLEVPLLTLKPDPGWWLAGEVWVRSGVGFLRRPWEAVKRRLGRGMEAEPQARLLKDLGRALKPIKEWLTEQVKAQLIDYGERLKFQYFLPLVDRWRAEQQSNLEDALGSLAAGLEGVMGTMHLEEEERASRERRLEELIPRVKEIEGRLTSPTPIT
jgi:hypothetical protein